MFGSEKNIGQIYRDVHAHEYIQRKTDAPYPAVREAQPIQSICLWRYYSIGSDNIVFCMPLYVDGIPSHVLPFLKELESFSVDNKLSSKVYVIANNGFIEGRQNEPLMQVMENFCSRSGVFRHFAEDCKCSTSMTARIDVTDLVEYSKIKLPGQLFE